MKRLLYSIFSIIVIAFYAISCNDDSDVTVNENGTITTKGNIILPSEITHSYEDCTVLTIGGISPIENGSFSIDAFYNENVQTFFVQNDANEVFLMNRSSMQNGDIIEFNVQTTTIALITSHPLFSPISSEDYQDVITFITSNPNYQSLYDEVEKVVKEKKNIFDNNNEALLLAFSNIMEDICGDVSTNNDYSDSLDELISETRAIYKNPKIYPLYAAINGNVLTLRNTGLTPSYYGTVKTADGNIVNYCVPSRSDYGGMDIFKSVEEINLGPECPFSFTKEGNYRFHLSRTNEMATLDFYMRIAGSVLSVMGLNIGNNDAEIVEIAKCISNVILTAGSGVSDAEMDFMDWFGLAYDATVNYLKRETSFLAKNGLLEQARIYGKILANAWGWYNKVKGAANATARITFALSAPEELNFCLCYYEGVISTCTNASLYISSGNNQVGYSDQRLLLPIKVYVQTIGDDDLYYSPSSYHRIKFEVVSGGGYVEDEYVSANNDKTAQTYWTLGEEGNQQVKATVVDVITNKEISEPVYFNASLDTAAITIRLDWSKHSSNTDIDLHVVDPYGERIYFYHMRSASGGYLDRDDTVGPGPEHIRWSNAPSGTYKIYVHYYPNEAEDRSVTRYTVTVTTNEKTYQPKSGSIAYDQMVPVGQFTIGGNSTRSSSDILEDTDYIEFKNIPKK